MKLGQAIERLKENAATGKRALALGGASGVQPIWLASQADMLADNCETAGNVSVRPF